MAINEDFLSSFLELVLWLLLFVVVVVVGDILSISSTNYHNGIMWTLYEIIPQFNSLCDGIFSGFHPMNEYYIRFILNAGIIRIPRSGLRSILADLCQYSPHFSMFTLFCLSIFCHLFCTHSQRHCVNGTRFSHIDV